MKILVGGGAGYIGSVLTPVLKEHSNEVNVVDLLWFGNRLPKDVPVRQADLFDLTVKDFEGYDQFVFLGGLSNDPMAEFDPALNFISNAALPSYLAFAAKRAGVRRFVYASSCSVYGYTVNELYDEESPTTCSYPYGISKLLGERGVLQHQDDSFSTIILRQGTVCGYSPRMRFDLIVNTMFKHAMARGAITVDNPSIWRPILDVRDTALAFLRAIQADYSISGIFNVGFDNFTVGQVCDIVRDDLQQLTGERIKLTVNHIDDFRNYKVTTAKARTYLGFSPRYTISDMVHSLWKHREEWGDYTDPRLFNIETFKRVVSARPKNT